MSFVKRIERVAIAVESIEEARPFFERVFGAKFHPLEHIEDMQMKYQPFDIGESKMELLEATGEESPVSRFLRHKGGPGVHHITFEVDDLDEAIAAIEAAGGRIAYRHEYAPGVTFEGYRWREAFVHPKDAFGVLIHLAEKTLIADG